MAVEFVHISQHRIVVCAECQYVVIPCQVEGHLRDCHPGLTKEQRLHHYSNVAKLPNLITKFEELPTPPPTDAPITALAPPLEGFECQHCLVILATDKKMRQHCREQHKWTSKQEGPDPWNTRVSYQKFRLRGAGSHLFRVSCTLTPECLPDTQSSDVEGAATLQQVLRATAPTLRHPLEHYDPTSDATREPNLWLRHTDWANHIGALDKQHLRRLTCKPTASEFPLQVLCKALKWEAQAGQRVCQRDVVGVDTLKLANKTHVDKEPKTHLEGAVTTPYIKRCVLNWQRILCYIVRVEAEPEDKRPRNARLTSGQEEALRALNSELAEFVRWTECQHRTCNGGMEEEEDEGEAGASEETVSDEEVERMARVQRKVLSFVICLLNHYPRRVYDSPLMSSMAVLAIREDNGWASFSSYTPLISSVVKLARFLVVKFSYDEWLEAIRTFMEAEGATQEEAEQQVEDCFERVRKRMWSFVVAPHGDQARGHPMHYLKETRSYGMKASLNEPAPNRVTWVGETILIEQTRLSLSALRNMVRDLVRDTRHHLYSRLLHKPTPEPGLRWIDTSKLRDDPSNAEVGLSSIDFNAEALPFDGSGEWLLSHIWSHKKLRDTFFRKNTPGPLVPNAAHWATYEGYHKRFLELLLVLTHITGGQPPRMPETMSMRWANSTIGGTRNVTLHEGLVQYVALTHKALLRLDKTKIIYRFLPAEASEILVIYLWIVLPFIHRIKRLQDPTFQPSPFLWGDNTQADPLSWTGPKRAGASIRPCRRSVQRRHGEEHGTADETPGIDPPALGEGQRKVSAWSVDHARKVFQSITEEYCGSRVPVSHWRHIAIAISNKVRVKFLDDADTTGRTGDDEEEDDDIWDIQAGHTTKVAQLIYGRLTSDGPTGTASRQKQCREISEEWHRFLFPAAFSSSEPSSPAAVAKGKRGPPNPAQQVSCAPPSPAAPRHGRNLRLSRFESLRTTNLRSALAALLRDEAATFRGKQEEALRYINNGYDTLVVMGTGSGKSLLFMLPASCVKGGTTIVIVPFVALQEQLASRCHALGIKCAIWTSDHPRPYARIILVTPECVEKGEFLSYLNSLQAEHRLDRFVFDECHTVFDSREDFRPALARLGSLLLRGVQMVYLTATMRPDRQDEFLGLMNHKEPSDVHVIRDSTSRPNIRYSAMEYSTEIDQHGRGKLQAVRELVDWKASQYPGRKIIVYCSGISNVVDVAKELGCPAYYAHIGLDKDKLAIRAKWEATPDGIIVASNALGQGIDLPDVAVVIHYDAPWCVVDFCQQSGRAGRNGSKAEAVILLRPGERKKAREKGGPPAAVSSVSGLLVSKRENHLRSVFRSEMFYMIGGSVCWRVYMAGILDGDNGRQPCQASIGEEPCGVCKPEHSTVPRRPAQGVRRSFSASEDSDPFAEDYTNTSGNLSISRKRLRTTTPQEVSSTTQQSCPGQNVHDSIGRSTLSFSSTPNTTAPPPTPLAQDDEVIVLPSASPQLPSAGPAGPPSCDQMSRGTPAHRRQGHDASESPWGLPSGTKISDFPPSLAASPLPPNSTVNHHVHKTREELDAQRRRTGKAITAKHQVAGQEINALRAELDDWKLLCPICYIATLTSGKFCRKDHSLEECNAGTAPSVVKVRAILKQLTLPKFTGCFNCFVIQRECPKFVLTNAGSYKYTYFKEVPCLHPGVLVNAVAAMLVCAPKDLLDAEIESVARAFRPGSATASGDRPCAAEQQRLKGFLAEKIKWCGEDATKLVQTFVRLSLRMKELSAPRSSQIPAPLSRSTPSNTLIPSRKPT